MAAALAWVLNLDADLELEAGDGYEPGARVRRAMQEPAERLASSLLGPDDLRLDDTSPAGVARGRVGRAFCPTPRALRLLRRAGAEPEKHPPFEVLRRVNSRAFASQLGPTLPGAEFVTDLERARAVLGTSPEVGAAWRVKCAFGMAGRNQLVVRPGDVDDRALAFVRAGLTRGGLQIEPDVAVADEYAMHGILAEGGALRTGALVHQRCNARGAWLSTERVAEGAAGDVARRLAEELARVGRALVDAGYFGPFGVDAYTYRDLRGELRLQPRSEINARYSMGFAVGFGGAEVQGERPPGTR